MIRNIDIFPENKFDVFLKDQLSCLKQNWRCCLWNRLKTIIFPRSLEVIFEFTGLSLNYIVKWVETVFFPLHTILLASSMRSRLNYVLNWKANSLIFFSPSPRIFWKVLIILAQIPFWKSLKINPWCHTLSKA